MNNCFNHFNNSENNGEQRMTSLEIAELTGKQHKHVMEAIRKMEIGWEKTCGSKFRLTSRTIAQPKGGTREVPCYSLTKTETLYIATKFNDEARARLVIRWEELERLSRKVESGGFSRKVESGKWKEITPTTDIIPSDISAADISPSSFLFPLSSKNLIQPSTKKILAMADHIIGEGLRMVNAEAEDTLTATQVAKTFNMTVGDFNAVLCDMGIQYRRFGRWNISDDLADRGLVSLRTHVSYSLKGEKKVRTYMTWTMAGLHYLNAKLGYPNF